VRDDFGAEERAEAIHLIQLALAEDHAREDWTTRLSIPARLRGQATLRARAAGVVAGLPCVPLCFEQLPAQVEVQFLVDDGSSVGHGEPLARIDGPLTAILAAERTFLNLVGLLSGTATLTRRFVELAGPHCRVLDTRKTWPGARRLQKYAVRCGGGGNHRIHLADGILLKDNHRWSGLALAELVSRARREHPDLSVVVEVDTLEQLDDALSLPIHRALLDNFSAEQVREAVNRRDKSNPRVRLEVSGGVDLDTVGDYARAGADFVSVGALTHSAPSLDVGLDVDGSGTGHGAEIHDERIPE